eukprot:GEMP01054863.1.p1 GENE.GEMP01054863.1~~GEMP01054863.1.p1  ORF type:complete len:431 (+),score=-0.13 GEMP01054863.1:222-1514(+)
MLIGALGKRIIAQYRWCRPVVSTVRCFSSNLPLPTCLPYRCKEDLKRIKELEIRVNASRQPARGGTGLKKLSNKVERLNYEGDLLCLKCNTFLNPCEFYVYMRSSLGRHTWCRACHLISRSLYYGFTLRGALFKILNGAKASAAKRSTKPGREEAGRFELDFNFLLSVWLNQQGRCAYSGLVMSVEPHTAWRFSLERLDNRIGYVPSNVVFICSEFNTADRSAVAKYGWFGSPQWSRDKVQSLPDTISASCNMSDREICDLTRSNEKLMIRKIAMKRNVAPNGDLFCTKCYQHKSPKGFYPHPTGLCGRSSVCRHCEVQYRWSFLGFFKSRLRDAKSAAKRQDNRIFRSGTRFPGGAAWNYFEVFILQTSHWGSLENFENYPETCERNFENISSSTSQITRGIAKKYPKDKFVLKRSLCSLVCSLKGVGE